MNATPTNIRPHFPVVLAHQAQRAADIQVRIAAAIMACGWSCWASWGSPVRSTSVRWAEPPDRWPLRRSPLGKAARG
jgi:hypothetical protein